MSSSSSSSSKNLTPIYFFIKDILNETESNQEDSKSLREIAKERWETLNMDEMKVFERLIPKNIPTITTSITLVNDDQRILEQKFSVSLLRTSFFIASSHTYTPSPMVTPAEIGIVKFSFINGITDSLTSLMEPGLIPINVKSYALQMESEHRILHFGLCYPRKDLLIKSVCTLLHASNMNSNQPPLVVIHDEEYQQTFGVLKWFEFYSGTDFQQQLNLIKLSSLLNYIGKKQEPLLKYGQFKNLCSHHSKINWPNCAGSKTFDYAYQIAHRYCPQFKIPLISGLHMPK